MKTTSTDMVKYNPIAAAWRKIYSLLSGACRVGVADIFGVKTGRSVGSC